MPALGPLRGESPPGQHRCCLCGRTWIRHGRGASPGASPGAALRGPGRRGAPGGGSRAGPGGRRGCSRRHPRGRARAVPAPAPGSGFPRPGRAAPPPRPRLSDPRAAVGSAGGGRGASCGPGPRQSGAQRAGAAAGARARRSAPPALLSDSMKVEFAPINVPLKRRIQTVAVLQWIFSFLLLGNNSLPPPCPCPREKRASSGCSRGRRYPRASLGAGPRLHVRAGAAGASGSPAIPGRAGASHFSLP